MGFYALITAFVLEILRVGVHIVRATAEIIGEDVVGSDSNIRSLER
jgi:hypothetical protein